MQTFNKKIHTRATQKDIRKYFENPLIKPFENNLAYIQTQKYDRDSIKT